MPSQNEPTELLVALDGRVFFADPDETPTMPTSETDAVIDSAPWAEVGYITTDGVAYQDSFTQESIRAWQAVAPIRVISTARDPQLTLSLMQWNTDNLIVAFGGGSVDTDGHFIGPLASDEAVERACALDAIDGDVTYRFVFPRVGLSQGSSFSLQRSDSANLSLTLAILDPGGGEPMFDLFSNSDALVAAAS